MNKQEFINSKITMKKGVLLLNNRYSLMYEHEEKEIKKQVKEICEKYKPKKVLEIGFGLGYSADAFQEYGLESHTIVEAHPDIYKKAVKWADSHDNVKVVHSFIQNYNVNESNYDLIFDDRCELVYPVRKGTSFPYYKIPEDSIECRLPPIKSW